MNSGMLSNKHGCIDDINLISFWYIDDTICIEFGKQHRALTILGQTQFFHKHIECCFRKENLYEGDDLKYVAHLIGRYNCRITQKKL